MKILKRVQYFSRINNYLERFKTLEEEVIKIEKEVIEKEDYIETIKSAAMESNKDKMMRMLSFFSQQPYENQSVTREKELLMQLGSRLKMAEEQGARLSKHAAKEVEEEKKLREKIFLADLARFSNKFNKISHEEKFTGEVKVGLELSSKSLGHILQREGVEFIGVEGQKYNNEIHLRIEGDGQILDKIQQRGIKIRGQVIDKAKISLKKSQ